MKSIEEKARLWDYYQDLVKSRGFGGIAHLLAENKRLQFVIDADNAQGSVGRINKSIDSGVAWNDGYLSCKDGDYLYTRPIPAQQSPEAPDKTEYVPMSADMKCVFIDGFGLLPIQYPGQSSAVAVPDVDKFADILDRMLTNNMFADYKAMAKSLISRLQDSSKSPRITEQDAVDILKGFSKWEDFAGMVPTPEGFCKSKEGRALFDKLNGTNQCAG